MSADGDGMGRRGVWHARPDDAVFGQGGRLQGGFSDGARVAGIRGCGADVGGGAVRLRRATAQGRRNELSGGLPGQRVLHGYRYASAQHGVLRRGFPGSSKVRSLESAPSWHTERLENTTPMAVSAPRARAWSPGRVPYRLFLIGLAAAVAVGGTYIAIAGNPLSRNQQAVTFNTAQVSQGTLQVSVSATGPVTNPSSVPLSFKSSGKLSEVDVSIGQHITAGQTLA